MIASSFAWTAPREKPSWSGATNTYAIWRAKSFTPITTSSIGRSRERKWRWTARNRARNVLFQVQIFFFFFFVLFQCFSSSKIFQDGWSTRFFHLKPRHCPARFLQAAGARSAGTSEHNSDLPSEQQRGMPSPRSAIRIGTSGKHFEAHGRCYVLSTLFFLTL